MSERGWRVGPVESVAPGLSGWLVTGAAGMLGRDLTALLANRGERAIGLTHADLDITDARAVAVALKSHSPAIVVNCAAWTAVDDAEAHEAEALRLNGDGPANLAATCASLGATLVQVSTDYVFAGDAGTPYAERAVTAPRTAYGRTKLAGERAVLEALPDAGYVVRTAWLYGEHGPSFVRTMIRLARKGDPVTVVNDQTGQPTWTADLAAQICALASSTAPAGIYHATSSGETTWFELAREIFGLHAASPEGGGGSGLVNPTTTAAYAATATRQTAPRPAYSVLGHDHWTAAGIAPIGHWRDSLRRAFPAMLSATPA